MRPSRPYHHGHLRRALLDTAAVVLRERGADELSLRALARELDVSHGAPARHFADRQALLDALAEEGFERIRSHLQEAIAAHDAFEDRVRAAAGTYVRFATAEANLLELLFAHNRGSGVDPVEQGAEDAFAPLREMFGAEQADGVLPDGDPNRPALVLLATCQGIAALVNGGIVPQAERDRLTDDAVGQFLHGLRNSPD